MLTVDEISDILLNTELSDEQKDNLLLGDDANYTLKVLAENGETVLIETLLSKSDRDVYRFPRTLGKRSPSGAAAIFGALNFAAKNGYIDIIRLILQQNADGSYFHQVINEEPGSNLALHYAAEYNRKNVVTFLLERDVNGEYSHQVAKHDPNKIYALKLAVKHGHIDIISIITERNAEGNYIHSGITDSIVNDTINSVLADTSYPLPEAHNPLVFSR